MHICYKYTQIILYLLGTATKDMPPKNTGMPSKNMVSLLTIGELFVKMYWLYPARYKFIFV
jgi:hypothetical protein